MSPLRPMSETEYDPWVAQAIAAYANDKIASGQWSESEALVKSEKEHHELLPQGLRTPDNYLFTVQDESGTSVGMLWFAVKKKFDKPIAFVFDIDIWPEFQRHGHGVRAFKALEEQALHRGLTGIALHVFGANTAARALYEKLGYQPTNISLFKAVGAEA